MECQLGAFQFRIPAVEPKLVRSMETFVMLSVEEPAVAQMRTEWLQKRRQETGDRVLLIYFNSTVGSCEKTSCIANSVCHPETFQNIS